MAVDLTLDQLSSGYNITKINNNFTAIENAFQETVGRTGNLPNNMEADLDLDSHDLLNVRNGYFDTLTIGGTTLVDEAHEQGPPGVDGVNATITVGVVSTGAAGSSVIVTDTGTPSAAVFNFTIPKGDTGASGAGTGDMIAAQNLNDVVSKPTAFANIKQAATSTATGVVELATPTEATTGTDTTRAVTPEGLKTAIDTIVDLIVPVGSIITSMGSNPSSSYFLYCSGGTIGDATSGGTVRANADTFNLFNVLWTYTSSADFVIQTSAGVNTTRGASSTADFNAHKRMPIPFAGSGGYFLRGKGVRSVGNFQAESVGTHNHTASSASAGVHNHGGDTLGNGGHNHTVSLGDDDGAAGNRAAWTSRPQSSTETTSSVADHTHVIANDGSHTHAITVNNNSGTETRPDNLAVNFWIRY